MRIEDGMGAAFRRWQELTDAYARNIEAMSRNEPGAAAELERLAKDIEKCETDFLDLTAGRRRKH
jgi:hypothetical protein